MQSQITNTPITQVEAELREEKSKLAKAFHQGKSMADLTDLVNRIHTLEQQFRALTLQQFNKQ